MQGQFLALDGVPQAGFERQPAQRLGVDLALVEAEAVAAGLLHAAQRRVGGLEQFARGAAVAREDADAGAAGDDDVMAAHRVRLGDGVDQAPRAVDDGVGVRAAVDDHDEFVARQARHGVGRSGHLAGAPAHFAQHGVAGGVPEAVVDARQAVDVQQQQGDLAAALARLGQRLLQAVVEQRAVGQQGQRVMVAQEVELVVGGLERRHVGGHRDVGGQLALVVAHRADAGAFGIDFAVLAAVPQLAAPLAVLFQAAPHGLVEVPVVAPGAQDARVLAHHLGLGVAADLFEGGIDGHDIGVRVRHHDRFLGAVEHLARQFEPVLAVAQRGVGLGARDRFQLELGGVALHHLVQVQVLAGHRQLGRQGGGPAFFFIREGRCAGPAAAIQPAVRVAQVVHLQAEQVAQRRVAGGQAVEQGVARGQPQWRAGAQQRARKARFVQRQVRQQGAVDALGGERAHAALGALQQAQGGDVRIQHPPRGVEEGRRQRFDAALSDLGQADPFQFGQARAQGARHAGNALARPRQGPGGRARVHTQFGADRFQDLVGVGRFAQHRGDAAALGHRHRFVLGVHGRKEDHPGRGQSRIGAQLLDELVAVHGGHQDVGDDQVGMVAPRQGQGLGAVFGLQQAMACVAEQGAQEGAVARPIVDDQDRGHQHRPLARRAVLALEYGTAIIGNSVATPTGGRPCVFVCERPRCLYHNRVALRHARMLRAEL